MNNKSTLWWMSGDAQASMWAGDYDSREEAVRAIPDVEAEFKSQCDATGWDEESYWTIEEKENAL